MLKRLEKYQATKRLLEEYQRDLAQCQEWLSLSPSHELEIIQAYNQDRIKELQEALESYKEQIRGVRVVDRRLGDLLALRCIGGLEWLEIAQYLGLSMSELNRLKARVNEGVVSTIIND